MILRAHYYEQFDADYTLDVPAEGYGGWKSAELEVDPDHTALVVMHAWGTGTLEEYPGWHRKVEYIPRADRICREVFPPLLAAVRTSQMDLFHVVGGRDYYSHYPGYKKAVELAGPSPEPPQLIESDPCLDKLRQFKGQLDPHNTQDMQRGLSTLDFADDAKPVGDEPIAKDAHQLLALCREHGVNHLIYAGFAINWCLLLSPGGMADMSKHGILCSALRQAVTAVENKQTARDELCKELGLWRVAVAFGYVFEVDDFVSALNGE